jgi:hypothetical protein
VLGVCQNTAELACIESMKYVLAPTLLSPSPLLSTSQPPRFLRNRNHLVFRVVRRLAAGEQAKGKVGATRSKASPPRGIEIRVVGTKVRVAWSPPAKVGQSAVISYKVKVSPSGKTCATSYWTRVCDFAGLSGKLNLDTRVWAVTGQGAEESASQRATVLIPANTTVVGQPIRRG